jgi:hypothetical protein
MEHDQELLAKLRMLEVACAHNREAFLDALRRRDDVSFLIAEARSLESATGELVRAWRQQQPASA